MEAAAGPQDANASRAVQTVEPARIGPVTSLDQVQPLMDYLRRIGAEPVNFQRAVIRETVNGYPRETGRVRIAGDGAINVTGTADAPTPEEATAVKHAFKGITLPKLETLTCIAEGPPGVDLASKDVFVCHDFDGRVVMIHQRYRTKDGGKGFVNWTRWSDGQWHKIEPEILPFFGLPGYREKSTLFIHEGAKAARRAKALIAGEEDASRSPWIQNVRWGHHIGWIGGVHAVESSDWSALAALGWSRVIIVADNDRHGLRAAHEIAQHFPANVFILAFDQRLPEGHDFGDDWPAELFDERGFYTGPSYLDSIRPATWATRLAPAEGRGRPAAFIRSEFAATVAYTVSPPRFVFRHRPSRDYSADEFNAVVAPFSHVRKETAAKLLGEIECQHDRMIYHPGFMPGTVTLDQRCFNVYEPGPVRASRGDLTLWREYLEHLIPDPDERAEVERWLATLIARPAVRMRYGLLLISVRQGVGKNTLANILKRLLGSANVSFPSENSVVESQFNGWVARKRLIFIAEIYSGHSRKAYDKLKSVLADDDLEVNQKGIDQYRLDNWATVIACSNSEAAMHLDDEDRRWFVPTVAETLKPRDWWQRLYAWIEGEGPGAVMQWAEDHLAEHGHVHTGDHAPDSKRKRAIVEESRSEGQRLAVSFAEHIAALPGRVILRVGEVRKWIALRRGFQRGADPDLGDRRLERPATILAAMKKVPGICVWADALRPKFGATREAVVMNFTPDQDARWPDIKEHLTDLEGVQLDEPL